MLWILVVFVGFAAANLQVERGRSVVVSRPAVIIPQRKLVTPPIIVAPPKPIIVSTGKVVVPGTKLGYTNTCNCPCHRYHEWSGIRVIESHQPVYKVKTKVAAPVYILPKHGPVVSGRQTYSKFYMS
uniref:Secreted protein n=1 Tax=Syphacia muris TaxID=451379 RepID=A0A0N5AXX3_9BILA